MVEPSLAIVMKSSPGMVVVEQADGEIAFVAGDVELVGDGRARVGQAAAQRLAGLGAQIGDLGFEFLDAGFSCEIVRRGLAAAFVGFFGVERLRALRAVAINGHALEAHLPGLNVSVADFLDGAFVGHVDGLGNRAADERLRGGHHFQVRADSGCCACRARA